MDKRHYDEFWDRGWTVVEGVFDSASVDPIAELTTAIATRALEERLNLQRTDRSDSGELAPRKLAAPFLAHEDLRRFVLYLRMRALTAEIIGAETRLFADQVLMKPPNFGSAKPYHQDNAYFECDPSDETITAWIALDDVDKSNGCLHYIDGSHRGPVLEHMPIPGEPHNKVPNPALIDLSCESPACGPKGSVICHHTHTLHTSHRNESNRWRRGYATHWAGPDVTCGNETLKDGYYNKHPELYAEVLEEVST